MIDAADVAAVLLAADRSRRFGEADKLLASIDGEPMARRAAAVIEGIGFAEHIVITTPALAPLFAGWRVVINDAPEEGQSRSIRLGVEAVAADAALIALADMPFVSARHIRRLLAAHCDLTASALDGVPMPPALFGRAHFPALRSPSGDAGARRLLAGATLVKADPHELRDIDRPKDLSPRPLPSG